jgi:hypothetical protein
VSKYCLVVIVLMAIQSPSTWAYDLATHGRITYQALLRSSLNVDPETLKQLGFTDGMTSIRSVKYFDVKGDVVKERIQWPFDSDQGKMPLDTQWPIDQLTDIIPGWLMQGAIREDDSGIVAERTNRVYFHAQSEPRDEPYFTNLNRWCNHFFDPYLNRPFVNFGPAGVACLGSTFSSAPVWATGFVGPFDDLLEATPDANRINHFSVLDAREAMWRALTGYDITMTTPLASTKTDRDAYWATVFRALGDVLHLNQDMAQPQHTRNEDHGFGESAWYEKYTDGRAKGQTRIVYNYRHGEKSAQNAPELVYHGYPIVPEFSAYPQFWSTGTSQASLTGKGLADYSNRGFLTPSNGIRNTRYPSPPATAATYGPEVASVDPQGRKGLYLTTPVRDTYAGTMSLPIRMGKRSLWGDVPTNLDPLGWGVYYTFDEAIYVDYASLLIPRAVAYSTGLLNYFFRGKLQISLPDAGFYGLLDDSPDARRISDDVLFSHKGDFARLRLKLLNATSPVTPLNEASVMQPMGKGVLVAILKYRSTDCLGIEMWPQIPESARRCLAMDEQIAVSRPVKVDESTSVPFATAEQPSGREYTFDFHGNAMPLNAWNISLQVVFRGKLGDEPDAVVVTTKDISEPTFMTFMNSTDYFAVNGKFYNPQSIAQQPSVFAAVRQECVDRSKSPYRIYDACFNRPDRFLVRAGSTSITIAANDSDSVKARRFIRVAFLADLDTPVKLNWSPGDIRCALPDNPLTVPAFRAQVRPDGIWTYSVPNAMRGVNGWRNYFCYEDLGIVPTSREVAEAQSRVFDELTADERKPMPVTITGW